MSRDHVVEVLHDFAGVAFILGDHLAKFGGDRPCESGDITYFICHMTTDWIVEWLCGWGVLIRSCHLAKLGICRSWKNGETMLFICPVTTWSKCHVTLCFLILSHHPFTFGVHRPCESGEITFFWFSRDHVIEVSRDFVGVISSSPVTILLRLGAMGLVKMEIKRFLFVTWPWY